MTYRDATPEEIAEEPTPVLEAMADGSLGASWVSRQLALNELARRGVPTNALERTEATV